MKKYDGKLNSRKRLLATAVLPLAVSSVLFGCKQDFAPDQEYDRELPEAEETLYDKLTDPVRDGTALEALDRGLVVIPTDEGNILSWRFLGSDSQRAAFRIYRDGELLHKKFFIDETFFVDLTGTPEHEYQIATILESETISMSKPQKAWANPYLSIPLNKPENNFVNGQEYSYSAGDATAADLTGDGQYEMIVKWDPSNAKDNAHSGATGDVLIDAYTLDGKMLWRINLGPNIRAGSHYTQFIAYDFNQDGRAEVAMKTADGTIDGRGTVIGDATAIYRNDAGYILDGPEFLTMFDGLSGEALDTIDYVPARGNVSDWGDNYGNRVDRFLAGVGYLDGQKPSLLMARGYYTRAVVAAYDWVDGQFSERWVFDTNNNEEDGKVFGQGAHSLTIGDVDADGYDEIVYGAATIDDDGSILYSTDLGHGDALHLADIDPNRPGLEVFMVHECPSCYTKDGVEYGVELHDAETGEIIWSRSGESVDVGRGVSIDIDPNYPGNENWGSRGGLVAADGTVIDETNRPGQMNFALWWDGDLLREILDGTTVSKWDAGKFSATSIFEASEFGARSNNGTKATPSLSADLFGDWREEVAFANQDSTELMIFTTDIPTDLRLPTLMHDRQYRVAIAWQNVGYNQPPHPSFYLGSDTAVEPLDVREFPQFKNQTVAVAALNKVVATGNNDAVNISVYTNDAQTIEIFRNTSDDISSRVSLGTIPTGSNTFIDTSAQPDTDYYYWAVITDTSGATIDNLVMSKTRLTSTLQPLAVLRTNSTPEFVELSWSTKNIDAQGIKLYRADAVDANTMPDESTRVEIASIDASETSYVDNTTTEGNKYYYWVEFTPTEGDVVTSAPQFGEHILITRTNLSATYTDDGVVLSWDLKNFPELAGSQLYRNTSNQLGGRGRLAILPASDVLTGTFLDTTAVAGETYWYMFKLTDAAGGTINTDPEGQITFTRNLTNLSISSDGQKIDLSWNLQNFEQVPDYIELYRNTVNDLGGRTRIAAGVPAEGTYTDTTGLVDGEHYWYMFKVRLADGTTTVNTDPEGGEMFSVPIPKANINTFLDSGDIVVSWKVENVFNEILNVELYRNTSNSADGAVLITSGLATEGTYADDKDVVEDVNYWYMLKITTKDPADDSQTIVINTDPEGEVKYEAAPIITSRMFEENMPGFCSVDGAVESNNPGFTGEGFANTDNEINKGVYWKVNVAEAGTYKFTFVYASGAGDDRWGRLDANGTAIVNQVSLPGTGAWTTYQAAASVEAQLDAGVVDLALIARTAGGLGNIDSLTIESTTGGNAPTPVSCN